MVVVSQLWIVNFGVSVSTLLLIVSNKNWKNKTLFCCEYMEFLVLYVSSIFSSRFYCFQALAYMGFFLKFNLHITFLVWVVSGTFRKFKEKMASQNPSAFESKVSLVRIKFCVSKLFLILDSILWCQFLKLRLLLKWI